MQLGLFGWLAKHDGKCVVPKFVPRSCIGTFRNEHTRSSPLDPKLMFWCVSYYFGAFGTILLPYKTRCIRAEPVQMFMPQSRIGIFRNESTRSDPLEPQHTFWCVSYYLGAFGTLWLHATLSAKRVKLVQKFVPRSLVGILATNTPDPPQWTLNSCFGVSCSVWGIWQCFITTRPSVQNGLKWCS